MKLRLYREGKARFLAPDLDFYRHPNHAPVFFNPRARVSRDVSVLVLKVVKVDSVLDGMAATGVRGIRYALEADVSPFFCDINPLAVGLIEENVALNGLSAGIFLDDVRRVCLSHSFDAVDIDPFGTPAPFLSDAVLGVRNGGYLLVTATDPGPLSGVNRTAALRKYGVFVRRLPWKEELAARILLFAIFRAAGANERGIVPIISFTHENHVRVIIQLFKKPSLISKNAKHVGMFSGVGPLWLGPLHHRNVVGEAAKLWEESYSKAAKYILHTASREVNALGFFDLHHLSRKMKVSHVPPVEKVIEALLERGFEASRTVFRRTAIKTDAPEEEVIKILQDLSNSS